MNTYLLGLLSKWATTLFIGVLGLFNSNDLSSEVNIEVDNLNQLKNSVADVTVINYNTTKEYTTDLPEGTTKTKQEGKIGLVYTNKTTNETNIIETPTDKVIEVGTGEVTEYVGKLTGYGADCTGCTGTLSCPLKNGNYWNLNTNGTIYNDDEYGNVRILAAALSKFSCGTVIEIESPTIGTFNAVVLDTGGDMRKAWNQGVVHMDLAFLSEKSQGIHDATGSNIKFNIKRWGW